MASKNASILFVKNYGRSREIQRDFMNKIESLVHSYLYYSSIPQIDYTTHQNFNTIFVENARRPEETLFVHRIL